MLVFAPVVENLVTIMTVLVTPLLIVPRPQVTVVPETPQLPPAVSLPLKLPEMALEPDARGRLSDTACTDDGPLLITVNV